MINKHLSKISNKFFSKFLSDDEFFYHLNKFFHSSNEKEFKKGISNYFSLSSGREIFAFESSKLSEIISIHAFEEEATYKTLFFIKLIIKQKHTTFHRFDSLKKLYEINFWNSRYQEASETLETIERELGESYWLFREKLIISKYLGCFEEQREISQKIINECSHEIIKDILIKILSISSSDDNSYLYWMVNVSKATAELNTAGYHGNSFIIDLINTPYPICGDGIKLNAKGYLLTLPLVDLFNALNILTKSYLLSKDNYFSDIADDVIEITTNHNNNNKENNERIVFLYEKGAHEDLQEFVFNLDIIKDYSFSLLYLIAKSSSHLNLDKYTKSARINDAIKCMSEYIRMSDNSSTLEGDFLSLLVNSVGSSHIGTLQFLYSLCFAYSTSSENIVKSALMAMREDDYENQALIEISKNNLFKFKSKDTSIQHRAIKNNIYMNWEMHDDDNTILDLIDRYLESGGALKDYIELYSNYCVDRSRFDKLIDKLVELYAKNSNSYRYFNLAEIMYDIDVNFDNHTNIKSVIAAYLSLKLLDAKYENILNEVFESYVLSSGCKSIGEYISNLTEINSLEYIFLYEVCSINQLDSLSFYKKTSSLRAERVKILDYLYENEWISDKQRADEIDQISNQTIQESIYLRVNGPKIFVDKDQITRKISQEINSYIKLYDNKSLDELSVQEDDSYHEKNKKHKDSILEKILVVITNSFLFDEDYGLDKILSTEIRHGFFSNTVKSGFEKHKLLAEFDDNGDGINIKYWSDYYSHALNSAGVEKINQILFGFNRELDALIRHTEDRMKIKFNESANQNGISVNKTPFPKEKIIIFLDNKFSAEKIINEILDFNLLHIENELNELRYHLSNNFRDDVSRLVNKLHEEFDRTMRNVSLFELKSSIESAKALLEENISTIVDWFRVTRYLDMQDRSIKDVINSSIACFKKIRIIDKEVKCVFEEENYVVKGNFVKPIITSMMTLMNNCIIHSGMKSNVSIAIKVFTEGEFIVIEISNNIANIIANHLNLDDLQVKIKNPASRIYTKSEGGTGLTKVYVEISNCYPYSDINLIKDNGFFKVQLKFHD